MKFNNDLAAIHGYLCSDGYVIRNPITQKKKYYYLGLRNTDDVLLRDFQGKFGRFFGILPIITKEGRCKIQNKAIYEYLTEEYSYYSYEWKLPRLNNENLKYWLRAFFDCEGWVENQPGKSRLVGAESCNQSGIGSIQEALRRFDIHSTLSKRSGRTMWRLAICGLGNIKRFQNHIGFLHPDKSQNLTEALSSYKDYAWNIPSDKQALLQFLQQKGKFRSSRKEWRLLSIRKQNLTAFNKALNMQGIASRIYGPWKNSHGSLYYCLIIKQEDMNGSEYRETKRYNAGV